MNVRRIHRYLQSQIAGNRPGEQAKRITKRLAEQAEHVFFSFSAGRFCRPLDFTAKSTARF
jgi:hypothetical protein